MSIHLFSKRGQAAREGTYNVDIYINNTSVETKILPLKNKKSADNKPPYSRVCVLALNNSSSGRKNENFPELKMTQTGVPILVCWLAL